MAKKYKITLMFLVLVTVLVMSGCTQYTEGIDTTVTETSTGSVSSTPEKEYIDDTWEDLELIYWCTSNYTDLQKAEMWPQFEGKYVTWTGKIYRVSENFLVTFTRVYEEGDRCHRSATSYARVVFPQSMKQELLQLKPNDVVTFRGKLVDIIEIPEPLMVKPWELEDGEIVEIQ